MNIHRRRREPMSRPRRAHADDTLWTVVLTLVAGALLALATGLCAFTELEQFGPSLGNIVVFHPTAGATEWWHIEAKIADAPGRSCVMSPAVMGIEGGSLIIEARQLSSPPVYRVHWAGRRTSTGASDCGTSADLVLSRSDLMRLADVAGGFNSHLRMIGP
jgi:hypothetical protein